MSSVNVNNKLRQYIEESQYSGTSEKSRESVDLFVRDNIVVVPSGKSFRYNADTFWADGIDRSLARYLHGLLFLRDWPASIKNDETGNLAQIATSIILDWYREFPSFKSCDHSMAFHDETTAQRLLTLIGVFEASKSFLREEERKMLFKIMLETSNLLLEDSFHSTGNNHGMFQDIALRNYCVYEYPNDESLKNKLSVSISRLNDYFTSSFTVDGVHRENSPTYHLMITKHLAEHAGFLRILQGDHKVLELEKLLNQAGTYATHAVLPSGVFLPLSDTQQVSISGKHHNVFGSEEFEFAATRGKQGIKPAKNWLCLPNSGYFYSRSNWGDANATFISFTAAYNNDYHKHSDDLSVYLWHDGGPLISEAGPFGYNYQEPLTKYGFSQYAHNNIIVNGQSTPRTDLHSDSVWMSEVSESAQGLTVQAGTGRLKSTYHERRVSVSKEFSQIEISDHLQSEHTNKYECMWNLGVDVDVVTHGNGFELFRGSKKVADVLIETTVPVHISVHKGEMKPKPLGWNFPKFGESQPTNAVMVTFKGQDVSAKTTIRLRDFRYKDRGLANRESGWLESKTSPKLNYLLEKPKSPSRKLAVIFSALASAGDFSYNYRRSIGVSDTNVLYILDDFGDQGSYYWLQRGQESVYDSVQALIRTIMTELEIEDSSDVSMFGTSKGGTAALLHGAGLGVGAVFIGAPQVKVGSFLETPHPNILDYMCRGASRSHAVALDKRFIEKLDSFSSLPPVHQIVGSEDHHYKKHALHLHDYLLNRSAASELDVVEGSPHSEIGLLYGRLLPKVLRSITSDKFESLRQLDCELIGKVGGLELRINSQSNEKYSLKLYSSSKLLTTEPYLGKKTYTWNELKPGRYRVRVYTRSTSGRMLPFSTPWIEVH